MLKEVLIDPQNNHKFISINIWILGNGNALHYSCPENPMDRGYSPWGCKELDTTEPLHFHMPREGVAVRTKHCPRPRRDRQLQGLSSRGLV